MGLCHSLLASAHRCRALKAVGGEEVGAGKEAEVGAGAGKEAEVAGEAEAWGAGALEELDLEVGL